MPNAIIGAAMAWKNPLLYFVVTATLAALQHCNGQADDSDVAVKRPSSPGSLHFRSVVSDGKRESAAPTRHGSLAFVLDEHGDQNASTVFHNLMAAKLRRMDPSVQCSDNLMTLEVKGVRAPHFLVDSGEGRLTPLSQMPSKCGFSVKRSRRDVRFVAPYQGCHVTQQGGAYVLPLRLWGAPMTMSCPAVLPPHSVSCFPSGMVVKIRGITENELKVKVSGTWQFLSSVCRSCGFAVEVLAGGLTLTAPYNRGLCIETEDEEHLLSLLLADVELLLTCPSLPDIKPTTKTTTPTTSRSDRGQVLQYQYTQFPMSTRYPVFPGPTPPTRTLALTSTEAPLPQDPQLPSGAATVSNTENQQAPAAPHPAFPFMPQFPQYPWFPRPVPPTQSTANESAAAPLAQMPQYPFPFFPQFPMVPGMFHPATLSPATGTEALVTTPAPTTKSDGMPKVPQQQQYPGPTPAPTTGTVAPLPQFPQYPWFPRPVPPTQSTANESAAAPLAQLPQMPQYPWFSRPVPPTQSTANESAAAPLAQMPQYPFPFFPPFPMVPGMFYPATPSPGPTTGTVAPLSQDPQLPSGAATVSNIENQQAPAAPHPAFPFMPQFPQYPWFPRPVSPTQSTANESAAVPLAQVPQMPQYPWFSRPVPPMQSTANESAAAPLAQMPQYSFPFFPQFPMVPGMFHPATLSPATGTEALVTTPAPTTMSDGMPKVPQQQQYPGPTPAPTTGTVAPLPQFPRYPWFPRPVPPTQSTANESASAPLAQLPQMPQYPWFSRPVPPTQSTANESAAAPLAQMPQYPFPFFPPFPMVPGMFHPATPSPGPTTGTVAQLSQDPQLPSGAATVSKTENQQALAAPHPAFPFMPQFPQYPWFPRPVSPTQSTANESAAVPLAQVPQMPQYPWFSRPVPPMQSTANESAAAPLAQMPQYPFPFFPQFPMVPGMFHPATLSPATGTEALVTTPAPTTKSDGMPKVPQQQQYPGPTPAPTTGTVAPLPQFPQYPWFPRPVPPTQSTANESTSAPLAQLPQMPQYPWFSRPVPPTQSTANESAAAPLAQMPQYPFPFFPPFPMVPGMFHPATPSPGPTTGTVAQLSQDPQLPSGAATVSKTENQQALAAPHPAFPFMPQFPQYPWFPRPVSPTQSTANESAAVPLAQVPQMPQYPWFSRPVPPTQSTANESAAAPLAQMPQYPFPFFPPFPMVPGMFHPATLSPATGTEALVTTPAPTTMSDGMPKVPQQQQYPGPTPAPTTGTVAPLPQFPRYPWFPRPVPPTQSTANESTSAPLAQLPQMPQYPWFSRPVPPTQSTANESAAAPLAQMPQYPFPFFPPFPMVPGMFHPATPSPGPTTGTVAQLSQDPQLPSGAATVSKTENQQALAAPHPAFPFMPQFPQYPWFPRPVPPTQSTANESTSAPLAQLPQMPQYPWFSRPVPPTQSTANESAAAPLAQMPQYPFPFFPPFPMVPGMFHPATPSPGPTTGTVAQLSQDPQLPSGAATVSKTENQQALAAPHPAFPFMPQFPQYPWFPRPVSPTQSTANESAAVPLAQVPQMPQYPWFSRPVPPMQSTANESAAAPLAQMPQYPFPFFPPFPMVPGMFHPATPSPGPTTGTVAQLSQDPQLPSGAATVSKTENQQAPAAPHPAFPFMPQFPQYPWFSRPVPPMQSTVNESAAAPPAQLSQMALYPCLFYPQFPVVPGMFAPASPPPRMPNVPQQLQFPMPPQYPFLQFPNLPLPPEDQTRALQEPKPVNQQPIPHPVYPQTYRSPVLYPSQRQNPLTAAQKPFH